MSREQQNSRETRKKPVKTLSEKRAAKKAKKETKGFTLV